MWFAHGELKFHCCHLLFISIFHNVLRFDVVMLVKAINICICISKIHIAVENYLSGNSAFFNLRYKNIILVQFRKLAKKQCQQNSSVPLEYTFNYYFRMRSCSYSCCCCCCWCCCSSSSRWRCSKDSHVWTLSKFFRKK